MTLLLIEIAIDGGVTTLTAELKGVSFAVNGIVGGMALFKGGLFWLPPEGLLTTGGGLRGLGATGGLLLSTVGSLPINLKTERSDVTTLKPSLSHL